MEVTILVNNETGLDYCFGELTLNRGINKLSPETWSKFKDLADDPGNTPLKVYLDKGLISCIGTNQQIDPKELSDEAFESIVNSTSDPALLREWYLALRHPERENAYKRHCIEIRNGYLPVKIPFQPGDRVISDLYYSPRHRHVDSEAQQKALDDCLFADAQERHNRGLRVRELLAEY